MSLGWWRLFIIFLCCLVCGFAAAQDSPGLEIDVEIDKGDDATYYREESIFISFRTSDDAYVVVYNIDSEGRFNLLFPGAADEGFVPAHETSRIPEQEDDYSLKVTGSRGEEFICAVASSAPLRIPAIFSEESEFRAEGEADKIMRDIAEDMCAGNEETYALDVAHFYIGEEEEWEGFHPFPPLPPFGFGCLQVISKPGDAKVYLDGRLFGKTPAVIMGIPPGIHELVVTKKLYRRFCEEVCIGEGGRERVKVKLEWKLW
jgi:hypothetical protein